MGLAKHVSGPWAVKRMFSNECETCPRIIASDGTWIAEVVGAVYLGHQQTIPNASLIAAAPDLLEVCKEADVMLRGALALVSKNDILSAVICQVQQAIFKAEGKVIS